MGQFVIDSLCTVIMWSSMLKKYKAYVLVVVCTYSVNTKKQYCNKMWRCSSYLRLNDINECTIIIIMVQHLLI